MESLYVIEPGCRLHRDGERLVVRQRHATLAEIPASGLKKLIIMGRSSFAGPVMEFLLQKGIDTVFLSPSGRFRGRLLLDEAGHVRRRQAQYLRLADEKFARRAARVIVAGKIANQTALLKLRLRKKSDPVLADASLRLRSLAAGLPKAAGLDEIRGMEGYAARVFFSAFGAMIKNEGFRFAGRNRRPPRDPVNALLSFVYTMFTNEMSAAVNSAGLDPYLGSLHEPAPGRPSLACDLVEEWRGIAERIVLALINRRMVSPDDFVVREQGGVVMKPAIVRTVVAAYEKAVSGQVADPCGGRMQLRWLMHRQAGRFAAWLTDEALPYRPFSM